jgi:hypothetical protein
MRGCLAKVDEPNTLRLLVNPDVSLMQITMVNTMIVKKENRIEYSTPKAQTVNR